MESATGRLGFCRHRLDGIQSLGHRKQPSPQSEPEKCFWELGKQMQVLGFLLVALVAHSGFHFKLMHGHSFWHETMPAVVAADLKNWFL